MLRLLYRGGAVCLKKETFKLSSALYSLYQVQTVTTVFALVRDSPMLRLVPLWRDAVNGGELALARPRPR